VLEVLHELVVDVAERALDLLVVLEVRVADGLLGGLGVAVAVLRERVVEERSYEQIAASMRCSPSVVRKRVSRGLAVGDLDNDGGEA